MKIATTREGSGIDLSGGVDPPYLVLSSEGGEASVTMTNKDGKRRQNQAVGPEGLLTRPTRGPRRRRPNRAMQLTSALTEPGARSLSPAFGNLEV